MKQIPYGIDDFERIICDDYYFIDKTCYIPTVENRNSFLLFVRPRRMGKSLFVNMLMSYYDINNKDRFDELFGNLWIGKNPTKGANKYLVIKFDFSRVGGDVKTLTSNFEVYCRLKIKDYFDRYSDVYTPCEIDDCMSQATASNMINRMIDITRRKKLQTYLFIDEYDNFSNTVLSSRGVNAHHEITHGEGFYRDFFKTFKGTFTRIFMTGVAPVTYDDLSSGFNIADVVSLLPSFDKVIGVTETELRQMIEYYRSQGRITRDTDDIVSEMKPWYDGFCFSSRCYGVEPPIYNTDMVLRYIKNMLSDGMPPEDMVDQNARTDTEKLDFLVMSEDLEHREYRVKVIEDICAKGYTTGKVKEQFPASRCGDEENYKSMLYYFGTLTFGGWDDDGATILQVPNKTMGDLYLKYMLQVISHDGLNINNEVRSLEDSIKTAAVSNKWDGLVEKIGELYGRYSSIRNTTGREADVNGFIRGVLCMNRYYALWPELELGKGFSDILLVPKADHRCPTQYSYLIELKYMRSDETNIDHYITEACYQLDRYAADYHLGDSYLLNGTPLTRLYLIFQGTRLVAFGSR